VLALLAVLIVPQGIVSAVPPCPGSGSPQPFNPCPGWEWVTFLGGEGRESAHAIAADSAGNAYVAGITTGHDFPVTLGSWDTSYNGDTGHVAGGDIFVVKWSADGSGPVYATLLGGSDVDFVSAIAVDSKGNAYLTGFTRSSDFPTTPGAYDASYGSGSSGIVMCEGSGRDERCSPYGGDAFVVKLNAAGTALIYSTFLGGRGGDIGTDIASTPRAMPT